MFESKGKHVALLPGWIRRQDNVDDDVCRPRLETSIFWLIAIKVRGVRALIDLETIEHGSKWRERANIALANSSGKAVAAAVLTTKDSHELDKTRANTSTARRRRII